MIKIVEYKDFRLDEIVRLYQSVGWTNYLARTELLKEAYENSLCVLAAYDGETLVGILRAVGDGLTIVFIQDILVLPDHQRRGLGTALLTDNTEKTRAFYRSAGFTAAEEIDCRAFIKM